MPKSLLEVENLRGYRDRDYVQTIEEYFFCVIGPVHPQDRVIAYLKYVPDPAGNWGQKNRRFRRVLRYYTVMDLLETLKFLERHPEYLYDSSVMGIKISAVPKNRVSVHFKPEEKMSRLLKMKKPDILQQKSVDLAKLISDESGVLMEYFGVTGSVLLDIHQVFSDIDLVVYGVENGQIVKEALMRMYEERRSPIHRFDEKKAKEWCMEKAKRYPLTFEDASHIFQRKWGRGLFHGTMFSMHPIKLEEDITEKYGDRVFKPEDMAKIEATVSDVSEADFLPAVYKVEDVKVVYGNRVEDLHEVASYEGLYGGITEEGEKIVAYGKLERVIDKKLGKEHHRILIGSKEAEGRDYIKPTCLS